jgi:uncharacterized protein YhfF
MSRLKTAEFAFPGKPRDRLVAAILDGSKTATTSLLLEHELVDEASADRPERAAVINSNGCRSRRSG